MNEKIKMEIEKCTTKKQVLKILKKHNLKIRKDTTTENGFSIWIDGKTRIYKPYKQKNMKVQGWQKVELKASGIPTFFANPSYF